MISYVEGSEFGIYMVKYGVYSWVWFNFVLVFVSLLYFINYMNNF